MKIVGIDLAWNSENNTTALAIGDLNGDMFRLDIVHEALAGLDEIVDVVHQEGDVSQANSGRQPAGRSAFSDSDVHRVYPCGQLENRPPEAVHAHRLHSEHTIQAAAYFH